MSFELLIARQAGVVSRDQALRAGLDPSAVDRLVRTRRWRPLHPRVYLTPGHPAGDEARAWAAVLWAGPGAVLSGAAAAWWHGLLDDAPPVLAVSAPSRRPPRPGAAVRCRLLDAPDRTERRGLPVTAAALAALEAAVELGGTAGRDLLRRALPRVGPAEVLAAHRRHPTLAGRALLAGLASRPRGDLHHPRGVDRALHRRVEVRASSLRRQARCGAGLP
ncbi:MAG TPA: type IV toxin-antitoxin system AbiEi family antitoxin domain-containing protein [Pseudonocardia sp.]|uniref:type IV toxin-antitoxin system AbiEi family antitoxin domain-containing protein n=1 Tax=Pseudonocardia sp. TaxID=60912 RepID=UPI002B4B7DAA|nr:type IV toxin-antitoxin system AbiEi family antitoxin domain-containing protein [Pseudonocardia sp.]HLU58981.1 type IV toxin-antitoxin system AbiEi family antitoxin domain-containing protein [Pseudonocardia sp.]